MKTLDDQYRLAEERVKFLEAEGFRFRDRYEGEHEVYLDAAYPPGATPRRVEQVREFCEAYSRFRTVHLRRQFLQPGEGA